VPGTAGIGIPPEAGAVVEAPPDLDGRREGAAEAVLLGVIEPLLAGAMEPLLLIVGAVAGVIDPPEEMAPQ
jgi:hypothetical protein